MTASTRFHIHAVRVTMAWTPTRELAILKAQELAAQGMILEITDSLAPEGERVVCHVDESGNVLPCVA